jgi:hypothetical protein
MGLDSQLIRAGIWGVLDIFGAAQDFGRKSRKQLKMQ